MNRTGTLERFVQRCPELLKASSLACLLLLGTILAASCGDDEDDLETVSKDSLSPAAGESATTPDQQFFPCYTQLTPEDTAQPSVTSTPETVRIQMLERPYRIIPNDIVLIQNRQYRLIIQAGEEWHQFATEVLSQDVLLPPGGEAEILVQPQLLGIFPIHNNRRIQESLLPSTITVVPEGIEPSTWYPFCAEFSVHSPPPDANLSTPFVIEGTVGPVILQPTIMEPVGQLLFVSRIEAWNNGQIVGSTTSEQFRSRGLDSDFYITIPSLPPGSHTLRLRASLQNGSIAATATLPLMVPVDTSSGSLLPGYRGNIDLPIDNAFLDLPITIQGWVVNPGTKDGTGVGSVEIWNGPRESGQFLTEAIYGTYRPDVADSLDDPTYASSGFIAQLSNVPAGPVDLHLYVRDRESGDYVSPRFRQSPLVRKIALAEGKVADATWPVALAAAPDGRLFYAELLTGNIRIVKDGQVLPKPFATLENVSNFRESGFMGLALHPDFATTPYVYAMYVVDNPSTGIPSGQRVVRFRDVDDIGQEYTVILDNLPALTISFHNGGRIAFGPDGMLYVSIGDTGEGELAQDPKRLEGSILRYNPDGSIPSDNPIPGSPVYAIGLRNVFGLAFQPETGFLYATDNGPGGFDEVNKIEAGYNYGWPDHMGNESPEGYKDPVAVYGNWPETPIGPTGATFSPEQPDLLLFCAFHDFFLRAVRLNGPEYATAQSTTVLSNNCALDVTYSSDGWLYYSTISEIYRARIDELLRLYELNTR